MVENGFHGGFYVIIVGERFAHAHEHNVCDILGEVWIFVKKYFPETILINYFIAGEISGETHFSSRAKSTGHSAANLRRYADRPVASRVLHEYGFEGECFSIFVCWYGEYGFISIFFCTLQNNFFCYG